VCVHVCYLSMSFWYFYIPSHHYLHMDEKTFTVFYAHDVFLFFRCEVSNPLYIGPEMEKQYICIIVWAVPRYTVLCVVSTGQ